jgi:tRNA 2-thiouridine synthesizing protein A
MMRDYDIFVDAKGLKCPQPLLLCKHAIIDLEPQQVLLLEATDPGTDLDLEVWCERFGHSIVQQKVNAKVVCFWIKKGP